MNPKKRILFIDHEDSFSNNLIASLVTLGCQVDILCSQDEVARCCRRLERKEKLDSDAVVFSPGPGTPSDYPSSLKLSQLLPLQTPVLGVCLGHQMLLASYGARVEPVAANPEHGRWATLHNSLPSRLLGGLKCEGNYVLYNSLGVHCTDPVFRSQFLCMAADEGFCLVAEHRQKPWLSFQFHPESFASAQGMALIECFLRVTSTPV